MSANPLRLVLLAFALTTGAIALFAFYVNNLEESYSGPQVWPILVKVVAWALLVGALAAAGAAAVRGTRGNRR